MHISVLLASNAGIGPNNTVGGPPGIHGAAVAGIHGIGVNTPNAAAVAAATMGLAMLLHMPKVGMFTNGIWSIKFAAGMLLVSVRLTGNTFNTVGAAPKLHCNVAPLQTWGQPMGWLRG